VVGGRPRLGRRPEAEQTEHKAAAQWHTCVRSWQRLCDPPEAPHAGSACGTWGGSTGASPHPTAAAPAARPHRSHPRGRSGLGGRVHANTHGTRACASIWKPKEFQGAVPHSTDGAHKVKAVSLPTQFFCTSLMPSIISLGANPRPGGCPCS